MTLNLTVPQLPNLKLIFFLSYLFQVLFQEFYHLVGVFKPQCKYGSSKCIQILAQICHFLASFPMMQSIRNPAACPVETQLKYIA